MRELVLLTGGTGKTGRRIALELQRRGIMPRVLSRSGRQGSRSFDWADVSRFHEILEGVSAVYLLAPAQVTDVLAAMRPFIDAAVADGVSRFVLLSASSIAEGGPLMGAVHSYLKRVAPNWNVLRPSWFMQNFSEQQHLSTIREEGAIYSATGSGRVGFVDLDDLARVAALALTEPNFPSGELILTGPQAITYDEVAHTLTQCIGRPVIHYAISEDALAERLARSGLSPEYSRLLSALDVAIAGGSEDYVSPTIEGVTGRPPHDFATFAARERAAWL